MIENLKQLSVHKHNMMLQCKMAEKLLSVGGRHYLADVMRACGYDTHPREIEDINGVQFESDYMIVSFASEDHASCAEERKYLTIKFRIDFDVEQISEHFVGEYC